MSRGERGARGGVPRRGPPSHAKTREPAPQRRARAGNSRKKPAHEKSAAPRGRASCQPIRPDESLLAGVAALAALAAGLLVAALGPVSVALGLQLLGEVLAGLLV